MPIHRIFAVGLIMLAVTALSASVHAQEIDASTKAQLRQLKKLCDSRLISAEVCQEKQRAILGLQPSSPQRDGSQSNIPLSFMPPAPLAAPSSSATTSANGVGATPSGSVHVELSSGWSRLAVEELQAGREALLQQLKDDPNAKPLLQLLQTTTATDTGAYLRNGSDTLQISRLGIRGITLDATSAEKMCRTLAERSAAATKANNESGRSLSDCGLRQVGGSPAFYMERDSIRDGTKMV